MALKIALKPSEKFVVNGAVIKNGDRRASLVLQNKVSILREKDILQEEEATTPAKRIYFAIMLMYLDEANSGDYYDDFVIRMTEFMKAIEDPEMLTMCLAVSRDVMSQRFYRALTVCRKLFPFEEERLGHVASGV